MGLTSHYMKLDKSHRRLPGSMIANREFFHFEIYKGLNRLII